MAAAIAQSLYGTVWISAASGPKAGGSSMRSKGRRASLGGHSQTQFHGATISDRKDILQLLCADGPRRAQPTRATTATAAASAPPPTPPPPSAARTPAIGGGATVQEQLQEYTSAFPPFWRRQTAVEMVASGVWTFTQALGLPSLGIDVRLRMVVIQLPGGGLWVYSPVALTKEVESILKPLGPVKHIVIPSIAPEHACYAAKYSELYPDAVVYSPFPPEAYGPFKAQVGRVDVLLGEEPPAEWEGLIDTVTFRITSPVEFAEVMFYHRPSRSMMSADLILHAGEDLRESILYRLLGGINEVRIGVADVFVNPKFADVKRTLLDKWREWDFDRILLAHGSIVPTGARAELAKALLKVNVEL